MPWRLLLINFVFWITFSFFIQTFFTQLCWILNADWSGVDSFSRACYQTPLYQHTCLDTETKSAIFVCLFVWDFWKESPVSGNLSTDIFIGFLQNYRTVTGGFFFCMDFFVSGVIREAAFLFAFVCLFNTLYELQDWPVREPLFISTIT